MSIKLALDNSGFEVYKTVNDPEMSTSDTENSKSSSDKFVALNGTIKEIAYYDNMYKNSFDEDYEGISNTGSVSFPKVNLKRFYKGKKICLKKTNKETRKWKDLETCLLGFIAEQSFDTNGVDVKLVGMSKLLDQEKEFSFQGTKRSEILKQVIESAGLKADVDATGLKDEAIDYTNVSSSGSSDDSGGYTGEVSADIAQAAKQICQGKTSCLEKAKAIWRWCHDNMTYQGYSNSQKGAEGCFKDRSGNCCDHANVVVQMLKAVNVKCAYEHSGSCYDNKGHVWAVAYCDGKWYRIDASVKSRDFDEVGEGCTGERLDSLDF